MRLWSAVPRRSHPLGFPSVDCRGRSGQFVDRVHECTSGASPEKNSQRGENCPRYARAAQILFGRLGLLVDCRLGDFGEGVVRGLFLIQRFLKQFDGVIETELFRPGL
jgi:hypothetical protein